VVVVDIAVSVKTVVAVRFVVVVLMAVGLLTRAAGVQL
jgi:hypothetical protein